MSLAGLSFNTLPPITLPFRFFITAPFFMLLCAGLIIISGETLWLSRWQPAMLALVHGFTLGFLSLIMLGALLQLLPVIAGIGMPQPTIIASMSHGLVTLGTLCLMWGFVDFHSLLLQASMIFLALGLGLYLAALAWVLMKKLSQGGSVMGFRLAIAALFIVLLLGLALLARNLGAEGLPTTKQLTNVHALWGLIGWAGILIIAVSFQVLPMFHVAPTFPSRIKRYLAPGIFMSLLLSLAFPTAALPILSLLHSVFALTLLFVIQRRKRKVADTSIRYWQLAAMTLLLSTLLYLIPETMWHRYLAVDKTLLLSALFMYFYLMSIIQGMLLKILPFLSYTHLQQRCLVDFSAMQFIPHMHEFLHKKHGQWLYYSHLISGCLLIWVLFHPSYYFSFALSLALESGGLLIIMIKTMRRYFSVNEKISRAIAN